MAKKSGHKATKKFAKSGQLKKTIQARHRHRDVKKRVERQKVTREIRQQRLEAGEKAEEAGSEGDEVDGEVENKFAGMSVDDLLKGDFMGEAAEDDDDASDGEEDGEESDEEGSFASVDELDDDGKTHMMELSKLAEKDPEFYKYLQAHDKELLDFNAEGSESEADDEDVEMDDERAPELTKEELNKWQKALLEKSSLRALRKLILAFRSAVTTNDSDDSNSRKAHYTINTPSVYSKLVTTALRYTPVVLQQHIPYKTLPSGKIKPPQQSKKQKALSKLILSYFHAVVVLLGQSSSGDVELLSLALSESLKVVPYVVTSRKSVKAYLKACLELWSTAGDDVRISAFLAVRHLASSFDASILDTVLKSSYLTIVRSFKHTTGFTLQSINLMKNTLAELYCNPQHQSAAYQHAFKYIRQLAIHLRASLKTKTKESHTQVYNWQYAHCVDFWAIVLSQACSITAEAESELKALVYPLVQVALGSTKLISNARSYPFHIHIIRSMLRITQHTQTYIPLAPHILPIVTSLLSPTTKTKPATLKPLDLDVLIRAPAQYISTKIYSETLMEECVYLLAEWCAGKGSGVQGSIAFPEVAVPVLVVLRKSVKSSGSSATSTSRSGKGKEVSLVKALVEHIDDGAKWIRERRKSVKFGPGDIREVEKWEGEVRGKIEETPLGKWVGVLRRQRERRRELVAKAREGVAEVLSE